MKTKEELGLEKWEEFKEANPPKGQALHYYKDNREYWLSGFALGYEAGVEARGELKELAGKLKETRLAARFESREGDRLRDELSLVWQTIRRIEDWCLSKEWPLILPEIERLLKKVDSDYANGLPNLDTSVNENSKCAK